MVECRTFDTNAPHMRKRREKKNIVHHDRPLICEDCGAWEMSMHGKRQCSIGAGLTDADGRPTGLMVDLSFQWNIRQKRRTFVFTLMSIAQDRPERLVQLTIRQGPKPPRDSHSHSHVHLGSKRMDVPAALDAAPFGELLQYFCSQTNLTFDPPPGDPALFAARKK